MRTEDCRYVIVLFRKLILRHGPQTSPACADPVESKVDLHLMSQFAFAHTYRRQTRVPKRRTKASHSLGLLLQPSRLSSHCRKLLQPFILVLRLVQVDFHQKSVDKVPYNPRRSEG